MTLLNIADLPLHPRPPQFAPTGAAAALYEAQMGFISGPAGARKLGYNLTSLPPGKRGFPFHNHHFNDEMFFILSGAGEVRIGPKTYPLRPGDILSCPAGGPETAHQIVNTGAEALRYLAISSMHNPDVVEFPDQGRFGLFADLAPSAEGAARGLLYIGREKDSLPYWAG